MSARGRRAQPIVARQGLYNPNAISRPTSYIVDSKSFGYGPYVVMCPDATMIAHMARAPPGQARPDGTTAAIRPCGLVPTPIVKLRQRAVAHRRRLQQGAAFQAC